MTNEELIAAHRSGNASPRKRNRNSATRRSRYVVAMDRQTDSGEALRIARQLLAVDAVRIKRLRKALSAYVGANRVAEIERGG